MALSVSGSQLLRPCQAMCRPFCSARSTASPVQHHRTQRAGASQSGRAAARRARFSCRAAAGFTPSGGKDKSEDAKLPNSREEAVSQAAAAIAAQLTGGGSSNKGFMGAGSRKLSVDVPVADSGTAATVQLAQEIVAALPKSLRQQFTIVSCGDDGMCGGSGGVRVVSLQACVASGKDLEGCLLIAGPTTSQLDSVMRLLAYWRGAGAVVLNAEWSSESVPMEQVAFIKSIEAVYCFLPLVIKVLFIGQEGAVFKWVTGGNPASTPWRVFGKEGQRLAAIGRMQQRPTSADLEAVFYNAYAANNPLNRGIKTLRGLVGGGGKDGKP